MMAPPLAVSFIAGMAWREARNMLSTLTCMTRRQFSGAMSTTLPRPPIPTLFSRQSSRPNRSIAAATMARACPSSVTSATKTAAVPPSDAIIASVRSARSRSTSTTSTRAPARASRIAAARPLPMPSSTAPPPVTIATLPSRPKGSSPVAFSAISFLPRYRALSTLRTGWEANASSVAALFAPQAELLLHRPIRVTEQHGVVLRVVAHRHPARHDKDIVRPPAEDLIADPALAFALDHDKDGPVGRAVRTRRIVLGQQLDERADRRHREIAARRVDVAQLVPVARVRVLVPTECVERFARADIGIIEHRRGLDRRLPVDRQEIVGEPRRTVALGPGDGLNVRLTRLGEAGIQQAHDRNVEPVEPDHRLLRLVAVVVPSPGRGNHEVAGEHRRALTVDGGIGSLALDDEAQRRLRMAVRRGHLAGQDQL